MNEASEFRLLVACATAAMDPSHTADEIGRTVARPIDWDAALELAWRHGMTPLLAAALLGREEVPAGVRAALQRRQAEVAVRGLWLASQLGEVVTVLESAGIESLSFKGPILALSEFGDVGMRQSADLDVLVREHDRGSAAHSLRFRGLRSHYQMSPLEERSLLDGQNPLVREDGLVVDLQWSILPRHFAVRVPLDGLFERAQVVDVAGTPVRTLSDEDNLFVCSIHGSKHLWERLAWILDVSLLLMRQGELDLERVISRAQPIGCERMVKLGFAVAQSILGVELTDANVRRAVWADRGVADLAARIGQRLRHPSPGEPRVAELLGLYETRAKQAEHLLRVAMLPQTTDRLPWHLPRSARVLYGLYRPVRLLGVRLGIAGAGRLRARNNGANYG